MRLPPSNVPRIAGCVLKDEPALVLVRRDLPQLLDADAVFLRIDPVAQVESRHQLLRQRATAAFGKQCVFCVQLHAGLVLGLVRAVPGDAHVARRHAADRATLVVESFRCRKPGIDLDAKRLRLAAKPAANVAEAHDVVAVIVHQRRQHPVRNAKRFLGREHHEAVFGNRCVQRRILGLPVGDQLVERARIDHCAGKNMRSDLGAFFEHTDADLAPRLRGELLQTNRGRQTRGPAADDDDIVFHDFAWHEPFLRLLAA
jgi:hypothetical protein